VIDGERDDLLVHENICDYVRNCSSIVLAISSFGLVLGKRNSTCANT